MTLKKDGITLVDSGGGGSSGPVTITDGVNPAISATVFDFLNSNPQAVLLVDTNGDPLVFGGGGTSSLFGAPFPASGTAAGVRTSGGNMGALQLDTDVNLRTSIWNPDNGAHLGIDGTASARVRLFDGDGNDLATADATPIGIDIHRGLIAVGIDGTTLRFIRLNNDGTIKLPSLSTSHNFTFNNETFDVDVSQLGSLILFQETAIGGFNGTFLMTGSTDGVTFFTVFAIRADDGQPINSFNSSLTGFAVRVNVAGIKTFRLINSGGTIGTSLVGISGSAAPYTNAGVSIYDEASSNHLSVDGSGRIAINLGQVGAVNTDVNIGNASNGTQRVVLASDQPTVPVSISGSLPVTGPVQIQAKVVDEGSPDYSPDNTNQALTQNKDGELRTAPNMDALIGAIEMLTKEVNDLRLVMQFAHGVNL